ncbi:hypothetical protein AvCA_11900 [Azotobacter vinelandii CA]|uniref:Uncharacterized protein n=2 Tax=Azotobacter vinelandii TaxID=354 RepID=C1DPI6_AZOVD|nr:hypothetical protein Avin_11900 [Azotobacter vinelandii DJ]AGK17063.1 hypothetical protein AvCA_11900 [Azotobacter vinelandii CA]AGK19783.1 hypothetical protein AvCA6_11900 [Azotobacter vinelandii CA6]
MPERNASPRGAPLDGTSAGACARTTGIGW